MMKQRKLKYKWMLITTFITFITIVLFCLVIIFFLKDALHDSELDEAERSSDDIINLFHAKPLDEISALDLNASLENFQEVTIFNTKGKNYYKQQMKIYLLYLLISAFHILKESKLSNTKALII